MPCPPQLFDFVRLVIQGYALSATTNICNVGEDRITVYQSLPRRMCPHHSLLPRRGDLDVDNLNVGAQ